MRKMRLTFVLPALFDHPIGGYKVHYQYANALAARGHAVTLVHAITDRGDPSFRDLVALRAVVRQAVTKKPAVSWFAFHPSIRSVLVPVLSGRSLPEADVTVLTAWQTAQYTRGRAAQAGVFAQIVYDYEFWMSIPCIRARMRKALSREDVCPIATSGVVAAMLREIGREPVATVQAGLLEGEFGVDAPIDGREKLVRVPEAIGCRQGPIHGTRGRGTDSRRVAGRQVRVLWPSERQATSRRNKESRADFPGRTSSALQPFQSVHVVEPLRGVGSSGR